jgi:sulfate/thiosulfate transport system permease protein
MERTRAFRVSWQLAAMIVVSYVMILVFLPTGALFASSFGSGWRGFIEDISQGAALSALKLTFQVALVSALVNGFFGLLSAYVLVRFRFPGRAMLNALVDLPFAIPTNVSGLMLLAIYGGTSPLGKFLEGIGFTVSYALPGVILAVTLVTFPFTIRALQPVLEEFETEMEEAAYCLGASRWQTFLRVTLPSILPGFLSGITLAFARGLAEFGAVVVVAGNIPMKTQLAAVYIYGEMESYNPRGATSVSLVLVIAAIVLLAMNTIFSSRDKESLFGLKRIRNLIVKRGQRDNGEPIVSIQNP